METMTSADRVLYQMDRYPYASAAEIALSLGLSRARVYQIMREVGVKPQRQTIPRESVVCASPKAETVTT